MITDNLKTLAKALEPYEIRLVGGCVRDDLLGITPKDIDLCTNATPEQMIERCNANGLRWWGIGMDHGTITIHVKNEAFEVTTLRVDVVTDGRHAEVAFTTDWKLDAARRDLTINAMMRDMDGQLYDYFNGQTDLSNGMIRFVGDADTRVKEDYLRILRFFRFGTKIQNAIFASDSIYKASSYENIQGLMTKVSVERIWMEMKKILESEKREPVLNVMRAYGVLDGIGLNSRWEASHLCEELRPHLSAIGMLVTLSSTNSLPDDWKFSSDEKKWFEFLVNNHSSTMPNREFRTFLADGIPVEWLKDLACLNCNERQFKIAETEKRPVFPVSGQDLLNMGIPAGKVIGDLLKRLKKTWITSNFSMTKDELIRSLGE